MSWIAEKTNPQYFNVLRQAMVSQGALKMFRLNPFFHRSVGITESMYAREIYYKLPSTIDLQKFDGIDKLSHPTEKVNGLGTDTLRFLDTANLIAREFGDITGKSIVEFGSNFGGLLYCLFTTWPGIKMAYPIDYPDVQAFSFYFLNKLGINTNKLCLLEPVDIDLFISEYSITEQQTLEQMYEVFDKYGKSAKIGGFIRCNIPEKERELSFINHIRQDFNVVIIDEIKIRYPNKILICKR